jgi:hypothetical protein
VDFLIAAGYSHFLYYDNFGNLLLRATANERSILIDLDGYLASNWNKGVAVYYFDICTFHDEDAALAFGASGRDRVES